jgi:hypothetical protein
MHPWQHYVALGDNFTKGAGDPGDGYVMLGTSDRRAAALRQANPAFRYTSLAELHLSAREIREQQRRCPIRSFRLRGSSRELLNLEPFSTCGASRLTERDYGLG